MAEEERERVEPGELARRPLARQEPAIIRNVRLWVALRNREARRELTRLWYRGR